MTTMTVTSQLDGAVTEFSAPECREGAGTPVYRDGKYCGVITREYSYESGGNRQSGWTFHAGGPYGNAVMSGFYSMTAAALWLSIRDDYGHIRGEIRAAQEKARQELEANPPATMEELEAVFD